MAIVKFGAAVTLGVGKLGGHVFQRFAFGNLIRTNHFRSTSRNYIPPSARESFAIARERFQNLGPADVAQWSVLADKLPVPDWDGDNQYLTARQFHSKATVNALNAGIPEPIDPFLYSNEVPYLVVDFVQYEYFPNFFYINFGANPVVYDVQVFAYANPAPQTDLNRLPYNYLGIYHDFFSSASDIGQAIESLYPDIQPPTSLYIKLLKTSDFGVTSVPIFLQAKLVVL